MHIKYVSKWLWWSRKRKLFVGETEVSRLESSWKFASAIFRSFSTREIPLSKYTRSFERPFLIVTDVAARIGVKELWKFDEQILRAMPLSWHI